jgi:hypothetical protein
MQTLLSCRVECLLLDGTPLWERYRKFSEYITHKKGQQRTHLRSGRGPRTRNSPPLPRRWWRWSARGSSAALAEWPGRECHSSTWHTLAFSGPPTSGINAKRIRTMWDDVLCRSRHSWGLMKWARVRGLREFWEVLRIRLLRWWWILLGPGR